MSTEVTENVSWLPLCYTEEDGAQTSAPLCKGSCQAFQD